MLALPAGTLQLKLGRATPGADVTLLTEHNGTALQLALCAAVVSQTKRSRLAAGGNMLSVTTTLVAKDGPLLVTRTR